MTDKYYTETEIEEMDLNLEQLNEYLNGWTDAVKDGQYKKKYVDMFRNR